MTMMPPMMVSPSMGMGGNRVYLIVMRWASLVPSLTWYLSDPSSSLWCRLGGSVVEDLGCAG